MSADAKKTSEAQRKATENYLKQKCDEIKVRVPKGDKEKIKAHAMKHDEGSVNRFINRAIDEAMARDAIKLSNIGGN